MKSYSETEVFTAIDLELLRATEKMVTSIPDELQADKHIRCHELARAVGLVLGLEWCDGRYGGSEHSWLWGIYQPEKRSHGVLLDIYSVKLPQVQLSHGVLLDVYSVGRLPQVQLIFLSQPLLPHIGEKGIFKPGKTRDDIDWSIVDGLVECMAGDLRLTRYRVEDYAFDENGKELKQPEDAIIWAGNTKTAVLSWAERKGLDWWRKLPWNGMSPKDFRILDPFVHPPVGVAHEYAVTWRADRISAARGP